MSTQHPDNVTTPFFVDNPELSGEDEVREAYYIYSNLGCAEQMWDCEGKEVDNYVVKKLLSRYPEYFIDHQLGRDRFLTLRVPNPELERTEAKILLETLDSIPRSYDIASMFYQDKTPPIFEIILPMTTSFESIDNIYQYYRDFVVGQQHQRLGGRDLTIADWIGPFHPDRINVIPLFEDREGMLQSAEIVRRYLQDKKIEHQRVFLARSDPAVNYGQIGAIILNKIALWRLHLLALDTGVAIYPIIGAGSAPFRGNLRPDTVQRVAEEYKGAYTFTIQSAFKYDYPLTEAAQAIQFLEQREIVPATQIDEIKGIDLLNRYSAEYNNQIMTLAPIINRISGHIPSRRKRKLHVGLFGYSRSAGGVTLPRAITFTAALYSIGIPPEILGINALTHDDVTFLQDNYVNFTADMADSVRYLDPDSPNLPDGVLDAIQSIVPLKINDKHRCLTQRISQELTTCNTKDLTELILQAGNIRKFLG
jgi:phosphoenolpyruvate carboxylase